MTEEVPPSQLPVPTTSYVSNIFGANFFTCNRNKSVLRRNKLSVTVFNYSGFTYSLNNNTNTTMMNNAITQTMKNRAIATRFVLAQGTINLLNCFVFNYRIIINL